MASYTAEVIWVRSQQNFIDNRYSRKHLLRFDGGLEIPGSASPHIVPMPYSAPEALDPEEAFVSSLSSCHMLWFLALAAKQRFVVDRYHDIAEGTMKENSAGKLMVSTVTLHPEVSFSGSKRPSVEALIALHHHAHAECFIANSVKTEVRCEPKIRSLQE